MRDRTAFCEPDAWVGQELPVLPFIDAANRLRTGRWNVLFLHPECNACQARLEAHLSAQRPAKNRRWDRAVVSTAQRNDGAPPLQQGKPPRIFSGELSQELTWLIRTPLNVWLDNGVVVGIWTADGQTLGNTD